MSPVIVENHSEHETWLIEKTNKSETSPPTNSQYRCRELDQLKRRDLCYSADYVVRGQGLPLLYRYTRVYPHSQDALNVRQASPHLPKTKRWRKMWTSAEWVSIERECCLGYWYYGHLLYLGGLM